MIWNGQPCAGFLLLVRPTPKNAGDEFEVDVVSLTEDYKVPEPAVTGFYRCGEAMAMVFRIHLVPVTKAPPTQETQPLRRRR